MNNKNNNKTGKGKKMELTENTRIYYGGDMANDSGTGTIVKTIQDKWGSFVDIKMDDGRDITQLPICCFSQTYKGHGGTRFVTLDEYNKFRRNQMEAYGWMHYVDID